MKKECSNCHITLEEDEIQTKYHNKCPMCNQLNTFIDEYIMDIKRISTDESFMNAMVELYQKDPIEYQLKMSQFKTQLEQQEAVKKQQSSNANNNQVKCPHCGSTSITTGARGVNQFWGLLGASKTVNRCANCGHTWKPKGR